MQTGINVIVCVVKNYCTIVKFKAVIYSVAELCILLMTKKAAYQEQAIKVHE